jgi:dihydroorotate dehydrogenase
MASDLSIEKTNALTDVALEFECINGFIFSNLLKNRRNSKFNKSEIKGVKDLKGNFSGKPTEKNANALIKNCRERHGKGITIIGCGGVFNAKDAKKKFTAGADLVQLITGMVYEGPQIIGKINRDLAKFL